ncbi:hypothetical protein Egran_02421 [Elaphomyces granulatus]|uniref:Uncharacterized protein n=1 Tax=Elaphomyces granulatus TaxID=519963 RepID=A0A232M0C8_9EURO|nr:hypothetical protein Egran_02421 [Elaphomyces granulatus]
MQTVLPAAIAQSLNRQWPCREVQSRLLAGLLSPLTPSPSTLVVQGISATCKSTIVQAVLSALKVPHAFIRCAECITGRHLLTKILLETLDALGLKDEWERFGKGRCENISTLAILLGEALAQAPTDEENGRQEGQGVIEKFVLVLDGVDRQREPPQTLLPGLARLGEVIPALSVVLILGCIPRPLFLQAAGVPHINFPPYTRKEVITIMTAVDPPAVAGVSRELATKLYPQFISAAYDSLIGPTAGTIPSFRSVCEKLWPRFVAPILTEDPPGAIREWDFARLLVRNRALFKQQGEAMLIHRIASLDSVSPPSTTRLLTLPYFPTLILTSAYVASYTPQRLDTVFFSKFSSSSHSARNKRAHHRRKLKLLSQGRTDDNRDDAGPVRSAAPGVNGGRPRTRITKSTLESAFATSSAVISKAKYASSTVLTARPFTLERLLAIYHVIDPNPPANAIRAPAFADAIYSELATLRRLRLVLPASGASAGGGVPVVRGLGAGGATGGGGMTLDVGEKWCINVSGDWIEEVAKGIGVEVGEWLAGGLD